MNFKNLARDMALRRVHREAHPGPLIVVENAKTPLSKRKILDWHYIGRPMRGSPLYRGSDLGNPFKDGTRTEVIEQYHQWLIKKVREKDNPQYRELQQVLEYSLSLNGISLICWCAPLPCHGDVVVKAIKYLYANA